MTNNIVLSETCLTIHTDFNDFTDEDLYIAKNLEKLFTVKSMVKVNGHMVVNKYDNYKTDTYDKVKRTIQLPKYRGLLLLRDLKLSYNDVRKKPTHDIEFNTNFSLYPEQITICDDIEKRLKLRSTNSYIYVADAGTGKTKVSIEIIKRLRVKTLIVLPNILLLNQWYMGLQDDLELTDSDILIWSGEQLKKNLTIYKPDYKIILTTVHTSVKIPTNLLPDNDVYFTIYDEIHMYATNIFANTFWNAQSYYNLGLTATPKKINGFENIFIQHLNSLRNIKEIVPGINLSTFNGIVKVINNLTPYETVLTENGTVSVPLLLNTVCADINRNKLITKYIEELYDENDKHCIYIFSDRRAHLVDLANILLEDRKDLSVVIETNVKVLMGGSKNSDIEEAINNSRIIFTTYQYSAVGVNIQKMNCMVLATPRRNNHTQIIGRIMRNGSDTSIERKVIDIVDKHSVLYSQFRERRETYAKNKFKVITVK